MMVYLLHDCKLFCLNDLGSIDVHRRFFLTFLHFFPSFALALAHSHALAHAHGELDHFRVLGIGLELAHGLMRGNIIKKRFKLQASSSTIHVPMIRKRSIHSQEKNSCFGIAW